MYKKALRLKLRFVTPKGNLTAEQLWDLSFKDLTTTIKHAKEVLNSSSSDDDLAFLEEVSSVNEEDQLTFDILKDVFVTKRQEKDAQNQAAKDKEHNERIMERIKRLEEKELDELTKEQLLEQLR